MDDECMGWVWDEMVWSVRKVTRTLLAQMTQGKPCIGAEQTFLRVYNALLAAMTSEYVKIRRNQARQ